MRSTFKILPYINKKRIKPDGTCAILCRVSIDGKNILITTGLTCRPEDWDSRKGTIRTARENNRLTEFRTNLEETYNRLIKEQGAVSAELLKNTVMGVARIPQTLLQGGEAERERLKIRSEKINSTSSYRQSKTTQLNLQQFLRSKGMEDIAFTDITEEFGHSFKLFLKKEMGYATTHVNHCLCWLNRLIYIAVDEGVLRCNPLEDVPYEKKNPPKMRHISRSELKRIMATPMEDEKVELARRMFIFSSLTGLAYADLRNLYPCHLGKTAEGRFYIRKQREKTNVEAFIPLHPVAQKILSLYNTDDHSRSVFQLPIRDILWFEVHSLGIMMGIEQNLSHHCARHTFGTLALTKGMPIESVSRVLGHTNIVTTQIYAKITTQKLNTDLTIFGDKLSKTFNGITVS